MSETTSFKILLIGDSGVGKTAILCQYCDQIFSEDTSSTIGVDYRTRKVILNDQSVILQLWDTAGQEKFRNITTSYYRGSQGILIVYDSSNSETLQQVSYWISELKKENVDGVVFLVGNKSDLVETLSKEMEDIVKTVNLPHFRVSAKTADGIEDLFLELVRKIMDKGVEKDYIGDMEDIDLNAAKKDENNTNGCC